MIRINKPNFRAKREVVLVSIKRKPYYVNALLVNALILEKLKIKTVYNDMEKEGQEQVRSLLRDIILEKVNVEDISIRRVEDELFLYFLSNEMQNELRPLLLT